LHILARDHDIGRIDNNVAPTPFAIQIKLLRATGQMTAVKNAGSCSTLA